MSRRRGVVVMVVVLGAASAACGGVQAVDVHDERLPLEARLWVGGAEDAVAIAAAAVDDGQRELDALERWADTLPSGKGAGAATGGLVHSLRALADARVALGEARLERAQAELALARAALKVVYAETRMRYDLGVADLAALRATRDEARRALEATAEDVDEALVAEEKVAAEFWSSYQMEAARGVDDTLLWLPRERPARARRP
ncbi:MAG: hypothetical protein IT385_01220 [Deltaproteobacteria bacterium]|nr:hypothetical protein [Deltaproteobacteria bacterium]